jgi:hypothetical protein
MGENMSDEEKEIEESAKALTKEMLSDPNFMKWVNHQQANPIEIIGKGFTGDATGWRRSCDGVTGWIPTSWDVDLIGDQKPTGATVHYSIKRLPRKLKKRLKRESNP